MACCRERCSLRLGRCRLVVSCGGGRDCCCPRSGRWLGGRLATPGHGGHYCRALASRLGAHIVRRTLHGEEDPRYARLREEWGERWRSRLFLFLQIQAAAALLLAATIFLAARNPAPGLQWSDFLGVAVLLVAVFGEGLADTQLTQFRANPANRRKVCDEGLWSLSRHPNYFFQWLGWAGYAVIAIGPSGAWSWGWLALVGPAFMYWLLVHVSGIPPLEAHMRRSRGIAFAAYADRVNAFWPGLPSRERST